MARDEPTPDAILGVISGPSVGIWFMHSVIGLFDADVDNRFNRSWLLKYGPYIHTNRNQLAQDFLDTDRQWLFSVDNDMVFKPKDVWALFEVADEKGPGIYGGPYLLEDSAIAAGTWDDEIEKVYHQLLRLPKKPKQVGMVGTGFALIHRQVLEDIGENAFAPITDVAGEDVSLCWRAWQKGYTPWLCPAANPGHFKSVVLYPDESVRNIVGDDVNLVKVDERMHEIIEHEMEVA